MDMTKFSGPHDTGYIRVRDQLWLWVEALRREAEVHMEAQNWLQLSRTELRENQNQRFVTLQDTISNTTINNSGTFDSRGGPMFTGNQNTGRDFKFSTGGGY